MRNITPKHWNEWIDSGIDPELIELNLVSLSGQECYESLLYSEDLERLNTGRLSAYYLKRYSHLQYGGWWGNSIDPVTGELMDWGCLKPDVCAHTQDSWYKQFILLLNGFSISQAWQVGKKIKYEHPPKVPTRAFFLQVPQSIWKKVSDRYQIPIGEYTNFWQWVIDHPKIKIWITEGIKKAASLMSVGDVAIGLPGIWNGYKQLKDSEGKPTVLPSLIPDLKLFTGNKREIYFAFDSDPKQSTQRTVNKAISKTGSLLTKADCKVYIAEWDSEWGKGVDDVIANHYLDMGEILQIKALDVWKIHNFSKLTYTPDVIVNRKYLPQKIREVTVIEKEVQPKQLGLFDKPSDEPTREEIVKEYFVIPDQLKPPKDAQLILLRSPKNSGKTEYLALIIEPLLREGKKVLLITHRTQLGKDLCRRLGIPYLEYLNDYELGGLQGYGLCHHSLHRKSAAKFNAEEWEEATVIIDECVQVLWDVLSSNLIEAHQVQILENLKRVLQIALSTGGRVIACDADLDDWAINYLIRLIEFKVKTWLIFNNYRLQYKEKWNIWSYPGKSPIALVSSLLERVASGEKCFLLVNSQQAKSRWSTQFLEYFVKEKFPDLKVLRIDRETVGDPTHPAFGCTDKLNSLLPKYDLVIASPTIETGVDIKVEHFDSVWAILYGAQTADGARQFLARYRIPVERNIWINKVGLLKVGNGTINPRSLASSSDKVTKDLIARLQRSGFDDEIESDFQSESLEAYYQRGALINAQRQQYRDCIANKLRSEHTYLELDFEEFDKDKLKALETELTNHKEKFYLADCVATKEEGNPDDEEFQQLKKQRQRTKSELRKFKHGSLARKYLVPVDEKLIAKDDDGWFPQIKLHYYLTLGRKFVEQKDRENATYHLNNGEGKIWSPVFNKKIMATRINFLELMGIPKLFELKEIKESDVLAIVEFGKKYQKDLQAVGINANWDDKPISVTKYLLQNLFGLNITRVRRRGKKGEQEWIYSSVGVQWQRDDRKKLVLDAEGYPIPLSDDREVVFQQWLERDAEASQPASQPTDKPTSAIPFDGAFGCEGDGNGSTPPIYIDLLGGCATEGCTTEPIKPATQSPQEFEAVANQYQTFTTEDTSQAEAITQSDVIGMRAYFWSRYANKKLDLGVVQAVDYADASDTTYRTSNGDYISLSGIKKGIYQLKSA